VTDRPAHPVGGVGYPQTLQEFDTWFSTEEGCARYLQRLRWPKGFVCPSCGATKAWETGRHLLRCAACQRQTSLTAGTIFDGTRKPLRTWFQAMWYLTSQKLGVSALGLKRVLGLGSYQTAWTWLHKLRRAMVRPGRDLLSGRVEVDETYVGGEEEGTDGRYTETKAIVVVALEMLSPKGFGRVRLRQVPDVSGASLRGFIRDVVTPGATVMTDGWAGYNGAAKSGYIHERTVISTTGSPAHVAMPGVHRVASLLKRWLLGTHQGAVSREHLDYYLDEYTFRFNRRASRARGLLFHRLMEQAVHTAPVAYGRIVGGQPAARGAPDG
jgi:transposase-like protein